MVEFVYSPSEFFATVHELTGVPQKRMKLLVKGSVPGPKNGLVRARVSAKQPDFI